MHACADGTHCLTSGYRQCMAATALPHAGSGGGGEAGGGTAGTFVAAVGGLGVPPQGPLQALVARGAALGGEVLARAAGRGSGSAAAG